MLYHDNGVAAVYQTLQHLQEFVDVRGMQTGGGFVQNVHGTAGSFFGQFRRQFDALGFPSAQGGSRLSQADVTQAHIFQHLQFVFNPLLVLKIVQRFSHGHIQHLGDIFSFVVNFQCVPVVTGAVTNFAGYVHIRQEIHFNFINAVALAGFTASAFHVKAETSLFVTADFRFIG